MKIRRFFAKTMSEALNQVKNELGGDAVIMSNKKLADGVEIVAAYDNEPVTAPIPTPPPHIMKKPAKSSKSSGTPTLSEIIGDSGPDSLKELLEKQSAGTLQDEPEQISYSNPKKSADAPVQKKPQLTAAASQPAGEQDIKIKAPKKVSVESSDATILYIQEELL